VGRLRLWTWWSLGTAGTALILALAWLAISQPAIAAIGCPSCYGFERLGQVYVDRRMRPETRAMLIMANADATARLAILLGFRHGTRDDLPTWFVEGVAVVISDNPQFLKPNGPVGSRCTADPDGPLPTTDREWRRLGATDTAIYARAACRVLRWMNANGGSQAIRRVVAAVASGQAFADVYRD